MTQLSLLEVPPDEFQVFHRDNPVVYRILRRLALEARRARPGKRIGIRMLWERMRWDVWIATTDRDFKLNDHHTSRYARLLMANEPELRDAFEIRERRGAVEDA